MRSVAKISLCITLTLLLVTVVMIVTSRENTIAASQHITQRNQITKAQQIILTLSSDAISPEIGTEISFTLWLTNGSDSPLDHIVHTIVLTSEFPTPLLEEFPLTRTLPFSLGTGQSIATPIDIRLVSTGAITFSAVTTFDMHPSVAVSIPGQVAATPIMVSVPSTDVMAVVIYQSLYQAGCYADFVYPKSSPVVNVYASEASASCAVSAGHNMYWHIESFADASAAIAAFEIARSDAPIIIDDCTPSYRWHRASGSPIEQTEFGWVSGNYLLQAGSFDDTVFVQAISAAAALKRAAMDYELLPFCWQVYMPLITNH